LAAIRPNAETETWFVLHFLRLVEHSLAGTGQGSTFDAVNRNVLEAIPIPLPPLPEQRRIAARLREALDHVRRMREAAEAQRSAIDALPQSLFRRAFAGELLWS
jgi:type I restriction enzyme S subunit